jgi:plasmid stabilization system protein ParE
MASKFQEKLAREAYQDIDEILDNAKNNAEKTRFTNSLVKQVNHLKKYPEGGSLEYKEFRVLNFLKLPFKLVYRIVKPSTIFVLAIFHQKRDPEYWKDRAEKYDS